jgi:hypothetical protein
MRTISATRKPLNPKEYVKRFATENDFSELVTEPCVIEMDGKPAIVYTKADFETAPLVAALRSIAYSKSQRTAGLITTSAIFGYAPRRIIYADYCRTADMSYKFPEQHALVCSYAEKVGAQYLAQNPALYGEHQRKAEAVKKNWMLGESPFTSGIVNKNNQLKYHFDSGNFKGTWSCMLAFKRNVSGGYLSLPEFDLGLEIADDSLLMFDGQSILHGVTPLKYETSDAYRFTVVYYSLSQMWKCESPAEELQRIKRVKTDREQRREKGEFKLS